MRARRTDANHRTVTDAIRKLGYPVKSLHTQGGGVEDLLVGLDWVDCGGVPTKMWVLVEVKRVVTESTGRVRFTKQQREWYAQTEGFPRLVVTSAQDAVDQLRRMTG